MSTKLKKKGVLNSTKQEDKIIKNKLGVLRFADMLGNVSQACKIIANTLIL